MGICSDQGIQRIGVYCNKSLVLNYNTPDRKNPVLSLLGFKSDKSGKGPKHANRNEHLKETDNPVFFRKRYN